MRIDPISTARNRTLGRVVDKCHAIPEIRILDPGQRHRVLRARLGIAHRVGRVRVYELDAEHVRPSCHINTVRREPENVPRRRRLKDMVRKCSVSRFAGFMLRDHIKSNGEEKRKQ